MPLSLVARPLSFDLLVVWSKGRRGGARELCRCCGQGLWKSTRVLSWLPNTHTTPSAPVSPPSARGSSDDAGSSVPPQHRRTPTGTQKNPPFQLPRVSGSNPSGSEKPSSFWADLGSGLRWGKTAAESSASSQSMALDPLSISLLGTVSFCTEALLQQEADKATMLAHPSSSLSALWHNLSGPLNP